jgi:hypothetical protein
MGVPEHACAAAGWVAATASACADGKRLTRYGLIADETDIAFRADLGLWVLDNGEYAGPIVYCPWCGDKLPMPPIAV